MRHASADPDRQPIHAGAAADCIQADVATHYPALRHDTAAERGPVWVSESGIELQYPSRLVWPSPWAGHIPFALWMVEAVRPRVLVELGVHSGNSYCAFLQAVQFLSLCTQCYGIDHWRGDQHSDYYAEDVYTELRAYHDPLYGTFSTLIRSTFEDARAYFSDHTIDLLHIDGCHTLDAVSSDLAHWLPKMSSRGIVLLHDINVREREFGVWRVWEQLAERYDTISFAHSHGLGVAYVGSDAPPPALRSLLTLQDADRLRQLRSYFARLGTSLVDRFERRQAESRADRVPALDAAIESAHAEAGRHAEAAESLRAENVKASARVAALEGELNASRLEASRQAASIAALEQDLSAARADTARHLDLVVSHQRERMMLRAEAARRVDEAERLRREMNQLREDLARHAGSVAALDQELAAARAEMARRAETAAALQRELDASRAETSRQLATLDDARASTDAINQQVSSLEEELARTRGQVSAVLAQRERAALLLREQVATVAALRREIAVLRTTT